MGPIQSVKPTRRRYLAVDPDNRLVAANLEADWNDALRALTQAQEDYERQTAKAAPLGDEDRARIARLASDFPALWMDPRTPQRERKRMVRLLIDDVTLTRTDGIRLQVRFRGGQTATLELPRPRRVADLRRTPSEVVAEIDRLLNHHTDAGVAAALNAAGMLSGTGQSFHAGMILHIRRAHGLRSREARLRDRGWVDVGELAAHLGICTRTVKFWHREGRLVGEPFNDKGECLYQIPAVPPRKKIGRPPKRPRPPEKLSERA